MDIFSFLKKNISIEMVVSEHTTLKRAGNYLKARCPFHHEKTASFTISPSKDIFYCFGCHKGGDIITFVSLLENCSQKEAALSLADRFNVQLPSQEIAQSGIIRAQRDSYYRLCAIVQQWCSEQYQRSSLAQQYIGNRGISQETAQEFGIGYFTPKKGGIRSLLQYIRQESLLAKDLLEAKILFTASDGSYYSPFEDRIIIPISDALGRVCGFGGRVFLEHDQRAKYYNSHENDFFEKSSLLFGLFQAKEQIKKQQAVFIVEGYMDCLMMVQHGYQNAVAVLGTACSENHLKQLSRYTDTIYLLYDGDEAGKNAVIRLTEKCWRVNVDPLIISLPIGDDPASYLKKYHSLDEIIAQKQDIFSFFISRSTKEQGKKTFHEKLQTIRAIIDLISNITDSIKKTLLLSQASKALEIPEETLQQELIRKTKKRVSKEQEKVHEKLLEQQEEFVGKNDESSFKLLLGYMLQNPATLDPFFLELCQYSKDTSIQTVSAVLYNFLNQNKNKANMFDLLWTQINDTEKQIISHLIMQKEIDIDYESFLKQSMQLKRQIFKRVVHSIKGKIAESIQEQDNEKTETLLQKLIAIQKKFNRESQTV